MSETTAAVAAPSFYRRFRRRLIALGLVLFLLAFGFLGLPPIVKSLIISNLSEKLGRDVAIQEVEINPLTVSATISGLSIGEAKTSDGAFTGWKRLHVNLAFWPLLTGEVRFQEIDLDGFHARVAKGKDGAFNFDDILATLARTKTSQPRPAKAPSDPLSLAVEKLTVSNARLTFDDSSRARPFSTEIGPLTFTLKDFHTIGDPGATYHFEASAASGEKLTWSGGLAVDPVKSEGSFSLAHLDLAHLSPYFNDLVPGELRSALVDVSGKYQFALSTGVPALTLTDGELTLRDVRFGAPGVETDAFTLRRLHVSGVTANSATFQAAIAKVGIEGVAVRLTRDAQGVDFVRLVTPVAPPAPASPTAPAPPADSSVSSGPKPSVTLGEFSLSGMTVEAVDLTTPRRAEHKIEDLKLTLRNLDSSKLSQALPLALEVALPDEGRVTVAGTATPLPFSADLDLVLDRVSLAQVSPYAEPFLNIRLASGTLRTKAKVTLRDGAASFAGDVGLAGFKTVEAKTAQDFLIWTDLALTGLKVTTSPLAFHADEIRLVEPSATLRLEADGSLNFAQAAAPAPAAKPTLNPKTSPTTTPAPAAEPVVVDITRVTLDRAAFRFEDHTATPAARVALSDFSGTVTGLTSEALGRAEVDLRGKLDGVSPVAISGRLNPLGTPAFLDLAFDLRGLDLQPGAGPYIARFAGRKLTRGNLNVSTKLKLENRRVDVATVVTLDQFFLGAKNESPDATGLPLGLALALLRDRDGKIVVDLPVKGSLDDPEFKIGRVLIRVLVNTLTKVAASPFKLIGSVFGGGGEELGWQEFAPGNTALSDDDVKKLKTIAKALVERPALTLDIGGAYDPAADLAALRQIRLDQKIRATAWETRRRNDPSTPPPEQLKITSEQRVKLVAVLFAEAFPKPAETGSGKIVPPSPEEMASKLAAAITVPEADLRALAEARAQAVRNWLLETGKIPSERLFLSAAAPKGARVNLALQ